MLGFVGCALVLIRIVHVCAIEFVFRIKAEIVLWVNIQVVVYIVLQSSVAC